MMSTQTGPPGPNGPDENPSRRAVRPWEWTVLAVVAAVVVGLGATLMIRGGGEQADAAPATSTVTETVPAVGTAGAPATTGPATTGPATTEAGTTGPGETQPGETDPGETEPTTGGRHTGHGAAGHAADASPADGTSGHGSSGDAGNAATNAVQPPGVTTPGATTGKAGPIGPLGDQARRIKGDPLAMGDVDAPVVMVMFEDYRCPFCAKFSRDLEPQLVKKYVDSGKLRLEWRDFPIYGDQSVRAAVAARAAGEQGKFWQFNSAVFAAAPETGHPDISVDDLIGFAKDAGVGDIDAFRQSLNDPDLKAAVEKDFRHGSDLGVPATPSFIINGYPMRGAQPIDRFVQLIDTVESLQ